MRCKTVRLVVMLALVLLTAPLAATAQPSAKVYRIGYLSNLSGYGSQGEAFTQRLRDLGYTEGQHLVIEARFAHSTLARLPALAAELVRLKVDCLVASGISATRAAKQATSTIPIVMLHASDDPVRLGLITSLARPGGHITGIIDIAEPLAGKRLELRHEALPEIARVGHLAVKNSPAGAAHLKEVEAAARLVGVHIHPLEVQGPEDLAQAFRAARAERADGLIVVTFGFLNSHIERIVKRGDTIRLPVMYTSAEFVKSGGLMSYADEPLERARRPARGAAHEVQAGPQPQDSAGARDHVPPDAPRLGG